jgi:hypothetical protein
MNGVIFVILSVIWDSVLESVASFFSSSRLQKRSEKCGWLRGVIMQTNYRH